MPRLAAVLALCLLPAALPAGDEKPVDITQEQLFNERDDYHGKLVRFEGVVDTVRAAKDDQGKDWYGLHLRETTGFMAIRCAGVPAVANGDRVRVTGVLTVNTTLIPLRLAVEPPHGKVAKVAAEHVAWGTAIDGLQLGLGLRDGRVYRTGDTTTFVLKIRNISDKPATFSYFHPVTLFGAEVKAAEGTKALERTPWLGIPGAFPVWESRGLKAGEVLDLVTVSLPVQQRPAGDRRPALFMDVPPGTYQAVFGEKGRAMILAGDLDVRRGPKLQNGLRLRTGVLTFEVRAAAAEKK